MGHAGLCELPRREPRALEIRPRLVDPDMDLATVVVGHLDDAERGPELAAGERPGVAVGQDPQRAVGGEDELVDPEPGQPAVVLGRLEDDRVGLVADRGGDRVAVLRQIADGVVAPPSPGRPPSPG